VWTEEVDKLIVAGHLGWEEWRGITKVARQDVTGEITEEQEEKN
jgi:2',3'-cyclic-nucleotide 2'-phosphodiesterase (5'-nucleotidase family)